MKLRQFTVQSPWGNSFDFTAPFELTGKEEVLAEYSRAAGVEAFAMRVAENCGDVRLFTAKGVELKGDMTLMQLFEGEPPCDSPVLFLRVAFYGGCKRAASAVASGHKEKKQISILAAFRFSNAQVSERGPCYLSIYLSIYLYLYIYINISLYR